MKFNPKHFFFIIRRVTLAGTAALFAFLWVYNLWTPENKEFYFLTITFPFALLVVFFGMIISLANRKFIFSLCCLVLLVSGYRVIGETFRWNSISKPSTNERTFQLMTYNVSSFSPMRYKKFEGDENNNNKIFEWFRGIEKPDVLCVQEFFHGYSNNAELTLDSIKTIGGYGYYYLNPYYRDLYNGFFGVVTFSKFKAVKAGEFIFGHSVLNKGVYHDLLIHGDTLRVINVHLSSMSLRMMPREGNNVINYLALNASNLTVRLSKGYDEHSVEINAISKFVSESPHSVILCGDFNSTPYSYPYQTIKNQLLNAFEEKGKGFGITYQYAPFYVRIDNIFFDKQLKINNFKVHTENLHSDHYPISAIFEL